MVVVPDNRDDLIRHYTFSETDLSIIRQHRGAANRLGFAVQLCYMRYPGISLSTNAAPSPPLLRMVAEQLGLDQREWANYPARAQTRREHLVELKNVFGFKSFTTQEHHWRAVQSLEDLSWQTEKGIVLATALIQSLRGQSVLLPPLDVIERICAEAIARSTKRIYTALAGPLFRENRLHLDALLDLHGKNKFSVLTWLRQSPGAPGAANLLEHIARLKVMESIGLPAGIEHQIHQNRLLKLAREGRQMTTQHLRDLTATRRYATLVAVVLETRATVIDEIVDMHDRIIGAMFNRAKHVHEQEFQESGKAINEKVLLYWRIGSALLEARQTGSDPFAAIENIISWDIFTRSVTEAEKLAQPEDFDHLQGIADGYPRIRRYAPAFLEALRFKAAPAAQEILDAVDELKTLNARNARELPKDAPTGFVRKRWKDLVFRDDGLDRCFYELCVLSELKNALRAGDVWVRGSRQFKDFTNICCLSASS